MKAPDVRKLYLDYMLGHIKLHESSDGIRLLKINLAACLYWLSLPSDL